MSSDVNQRISSLINKLNSTLFSVFPFTETEAVYDPDHLANIVDEAISKLKKFEKFLKIRLKFHNSWSELQKILQDKFEPVDNKTFGIFFDSIYNEVETSIKEATTDAIGLKETLSSLKALITNVDLTFKRAILFKKLVLFDDEKGVSLLSNLGKLIKENKISEVNEKITTIEQEIKKIK